MWLDRPDQWDKLAEYLRAAGEFGIDTETHGQPDKTSPQHRARVHCWSVGVLTEARSPRGYRRAVGRVLPHAALEHPAIRSVLADVGARKWAHNAPHDRHALENEGVEVRGLEDSLQWFRVAVPGRGDYGLKDAEVAVLGYPSRPSWVDLVSHTVPVVHVKKHKVRACLCGRVPCRARSSSEWVRPDGTWQKHTRVEHVTEEQVVKQEPARYAVTDFVPGAQLDPLVWTPTKDKRTGLIKTPPAWWKGQPLDRLAEWWAYSAADAIRGMELVDWLRNLKPVSVRYPWQPVVGVR